MAIKNIIFDLGGVILDIDFQLTFDAFIKLGAQQADVFYNPNYENDFFCDFETGEINADVFRYFLKKELNITATDQEFDQAWNAMLLQFPHDRLQFLKTLRQEFKLFLFSNTNEIHSKAIANICQKEIGFHTLENYFDREYYSHVFGKRKPNPDAFLLILKENGIAAQETLFVDDLKQHVEGAKKAGLHAFHMTKEKSIFDLVNLIEDINQKK